jgi:saccharopine dehydrogenase-like NADP-dependent oxidoreductase
MHNGFCEVFMPKKRLLVLGCGMQGKAALDDLFHQVESCSIVVADNRPDLIDYLGRYPRDRVSGRGLDLARRDELRGLMAGASVVVEALPPQFAPEVARVAAETGVSLVSSMYYVNPLVTDPVAIEKTKRDLERINREAEAKGIVILPELGLDPGIDLVLGARALAELDRVHTFNSYGTGLPVPEHAGNPLQYKFSWSVLGVLRAARRPAKVVTRGQVRDIPGHEIFHPHNIHTIDVDELGTVECYANGNAAHYLEAFHLQGKVQEMGRYACRYPGHCAFWYRLVNSGFLDEEALAVNDASISPIDFTAALLSSQDQFWFALQEQDLAMVRVDLTGWSGETARRVVYQLVDRRDQGTGFTAMQRTVGYTMALGARLILDCRLPRCGLLSPVEVPFDLLEDGLRDHGMRITREQLPWQAPGDGETAP